jgi:hypothetical protein
MSKKPGFGSVGLSEDSLNFIKGYVSGNASDVFQFTPFHTITSAFLFFFSLGYEINDIRKEASTGNIAPRGFPIESFEVLLMQEAIDNKKSIGALISGYAEGGIAYLKGKIENGGSLSSIFSDLNDF